MQVPAQRIALGTTADSPREQDSPRENVASEGIPPLGEGIHALFGGTWDRD